MNVNDDLFIWVEKYRPKLIKDCILPTKIEKQLKSFVEKKEIPHLMFSGSAGIGKTTVAKALINELNSDFLIINASKDSNIDTLRTTISQFASSKSLTGSLKIVILDEADHLNPSSTQPALRNFMEEFSKNTRFIFTCNYPSKIIEPLHSRCTTINFDEVKKAEQNKLFVGFGKCCIEILKNENIKFDKNDLAKVLKTYFPDFRRVLNELQSHSMSGVLDLSIDDMDIDGHDELFGFLKRGEFTKMRKWVATHTHQDPQKIMRAVLDFCDKAIIPESFVDAIQFYNEHDYKNAFVVDKEINLTAFLTKIMIECEFKDE